MWSLLIVRVMIAEDVMPELFEIVDARAQDLPYCGACDP